MYSVFLRFEGSFVYLSNDLMDCKYLLIYEKTNFTLRGSRTSDF